MGEVAGMSLAGVGMLGGFDRRPKAVLSREVRDWKDWVAPSANGPNCPTDGRCGHVDHDHVAELDVLFSIEPMDDVRRLHGMGYPQRGSTTPTMRARRPMRSSAACPARTGHPSCGRSGAGSPPEVEAAHAETAGRRWAGGEGPAADGVSAARLGRCSVTARAGSFAPIPGPCARGAAARAGRRQRPDIPERDVGRRARAPGQAPAASPGTMRHPDAAPGGRREAPVAGRHARSMSS